MATDSWKSGKGEIDLMKSLIRKFHPHLTLIEDEIVIIFKDKAPLVGGMVQDIKTSKAPALLPLLTDKKYLYKYLITIGADVWANYSDRQKAACLDHALCAIKFEEDPEKGTVKCSIRPPDFTVYAGEALRWGMWRDFEEDIQKALDHLFKAPTTPTPQKRVGLKPPVFPTAIQPEVESESDSESEDNNILLSDDN